MVHAIALPPPPAHLARAHAAPPVAMLSAMAALSGALFGAACLVV
jgi:hypothetical protein